MDNRIVLPDQMIVSSGTQLTGPALWLARGAWTAVLLLVLSIVAVNLPHLLSDTQNQWVVGEALVAARTIFPTTSAYVVYVAALNTIAALVFASTALFLAWRRSDDGIVLFTSAALLLMVYLFGFTMDIGRMRYPALLEEVLPTIQFIFPMLIVAAILGLFYLFPDGKLYPRWIVVAAIVGLAISALFFYAAFNPSFAASWDTFEASNNLAILPEEWGYWLFAYSLLGSIAIGLFSRLFYYRREAGPVQRQQMKLVLLGMGALLLAPILTGTIQSSNLLTHSWRFFIALHIETLLPIILPISIGAAVLRYRLWDVDLLVNRTLAYGGLTAAIVLLYGLAVGLAGAILPAETQWFIPALALAIALLIVWPARGRLQEFADRLLPVDVGALREAPLPGAAPLPSEAPLPAGAPAPARNVNWPMRLLQGLWPLLLAALAWQIFLRLTEYDTWVRTMQGEWLVQESLRALPGVNAADFARLLVLSSLWTVAISWLLAVFVFRRKRDEGIGLYVAYLLLIYPFAVGPGTRPTPLVEALSFVGIGLGILFLFIFPDGRFVPQSHRWRGTLIGLVVLMPPLGYGTARVLLPGEAPDSWGYVAFIFTIAALMVAGGVSQVYRYRHLSDEVERRQTRWVLLALALQVIFFLWVAFWLSGLPSRLFIPDSLMALITLGIMFVATAALPVSLAVAVLVDRLWQMDLVLNRTLVFGSLTTLVIILYVLVVGVLGSLFQSGNNLLLSILATGLIAVLFNPLRQRLQQGVNRLMYGQRDDPLAVITELGRHLENTAVPGEILPILVQTIAQTLKLPYVVIELETVDGERTIAAKASANGVQPQDAQAYALVYQGENVGNLIVAPRAPGETFTAGEERLLHNIARQAGTAVYAYRLTDQLKRSRERLVTAQEEERRRLRRDLHDGLGPQLATLAVKVDAAQNLLRSDPEAAHRLLAAIRVESQQAIGEIRRVVDGLRPSAMDQLGLLPALREFAAQNEITAQTAVRIDAPRELPPLPAAVEVAAYRIITEAVTNVVRHAQAGHCNIRLWVADCGRPGHEPIHNSKSAIANQLCIEIADDGSGLPPDHVPGVGLASMHERALELGGTFNIATGVGRGSTIRVTLPISGEPSHV